VNVHGKNAIVTGAGSGIGRGLAGACAAAGMNLGLIDIDAAALEDTQAELRREGATVHFAAADCSEPAAVYRAAEALGGHLGPIHVVCNNAGVGLRSSILETSHENFDWLMAVNVGGVFNTIKAFIPGMIAHGEPAHMVITCSLAGLYEMPERENAVYSATKMAVLGLARNLAAELRPYPIGVSALCPGLVVSNARRSGENRPSRFGGSFTRADSGEARATNAMTPAEIGRIVMLAIEKERFLIISHPMARGAIVERNQALLDEFDWWEPALRELGISTTLTPVP